MEFCRLSATLAFSRSGSGNRDSFVALSPVDGVAEEPALWNSNALWVSSLDLPLIAPLPFFSPGYVCVLLFYLSHLYSQALHKHS